MTPRIPLAAALLGAAVLSPPASGAAAVPGTWSGSGSAEAGVASLSGTWTPLKGSTSFCTGRTTGTRGSVSCSGDIAFSASCTGVATPASLALACVDTARNLHVQVVAAVLPAGGFSGAIAYERA